VGGWTGDYFRVWRVAGGDATAAVSESTEMAAHSANLELHSKLGVEIRGGRGCVFGWNS